MLVGRCMKNNFRQEFIKYGFYPGTITDIANNSGDRDLGMANIELPFNLE